MSQRRRRGKQWAAHQQRVMLRLKTRAAWFALRAELSREDILQEALLAVWRLTPEEVERAPDPVQLQFRVGCLAMRAFTHRRRQLAPGPMIPIEVLDLDPDADPQGRKWPLLEAA